MEATIIITLYALTIVGMVIWFVKKSVSLKSTYTAYIDWGDGSKTKLRNKKATKIVNHLYKNSGIYQIKITGIIEKK